MDPLAVPTIGGLNPAEERSNSLNFVAELYVPAKDPLSRSGRLMIRLDSMVPSHSIPLIL